MAENLPHVLSALDYSKEDYLQHFEEADAMARGMREDPLALMKLGEGTLVANLFYEASTRTRMSFDAARYRLGMGSENTENAREYSSVVKGESLSHTIQTVGSYADIIVMRHHEDGAAAAAAEVSPVPIINAGDGSNEHPTQTKLDLYTILQCKGRLDGLNVVMGGDLRYGRVPRSLCYALGLWEGNTITGVSLPEFGMNEDVISYLKDHDTPYFQSTDKREALKHADVVIWTRMQLERHLPKGREWSKGEIEALRVIHRLGDIALADPTEGSKFARGVIALLDALAMEELKPIEAAQKIKTAGPHREYAIGLEEVDIMKDDAILMHPMPIAGEIEAAVDASPKAVYLRKQVPNGVPIRMVDLFRARRRIPHIA